MKTIAEMGPDELRSRWLNGRTAVERTAALRELERRIAVKPEKIRRVIEQMIDALGVSHALAIMADISADRIDTANDEGTALRWAGCTDALRQAAEETS